MSMCLSVCTGSSGVFEFVDLSATGRVHTLTIEAQGLCGQFAEIDRRFRQG